MELVDQHTKKIMEGCKDRARKAGLQFQDESLEYIVTNRDLIELSPKVMIPTLYDYWVHDVQVLREKGKYELYPSNPYETVINTRPAISFYNDNNPDWLNVMIFYHVLAHIDFFQNNMFFRHTWDYDFTGQALSDKRLIAEHRAKKGRWVDYVIEFARGIDNIVGFYSELSLLDQTPKTKQASRLDYYFDVFLQDIKNVNISEYIKEVERYNDCINKKKKRGEKTFFTDTAQKYPEFDALFKKNLEQKPKPFKDLLQYLLEHSTFLNKSENKWMKSVMEVVRKTSVFFQPQIRTKIMNEGWASYWHETLFMQDDRINGHEVEFARVNAYVTSMPRVGLNPYALGMRLFYDIEESSDKGKYSFEFKKIKDIEKRKKYNLETNKGREYIFDVRKNLSDFLFISKFVDQDFVDKNNLFVAGKRLNQAKQVWEYYVKSRKVEDYRDMLMGSLYHPPKIEVKEDKTSDNELYLVHKFEGKPLVKEYIANTMLGIEYLFGGQVMIETSEPVAAPSLESAGRSYYPFSAQSATAKKASEKEELKWQRCVYTMKDRRLTRKAI
jgi:stage V sporulation protein R